VLTPLTGALSDRVGRRAMIGSSAILYLLLAYPLYLLVGNGTFQTLVLALCITGAIQSLYTGTIPVILAEMFPTRIRYTALSLSYGFSVAIFGGFSPFVAQYLIGATGSPLSPAFLVMAAGVATALSIWSMAEPRNRPLD
jgi:MHS family proline/betaine transporter-like MFS transporter